MDAIIKILNEVRPGQDFRGADFFEQGVLDSLDLTTLVASLEAHYQIFVDVDEVKAENFRNLEAIKAFLLGKGVKA